MAKCTTSVGINLITGAQLILRDKSHPRYMELYHGWRAQLTSATPCKQFPNFVRAVLSKEA